MQHRIPTRQWSFVPGVFGLLDPVRSPKWSGHRLLLASEQLPPLLIVGPSLLLAHDGLAGISHGVGYGEQKPVAQVIGAAAPTVRYYLPPISKRVGVPDVQRCLPDVGITTAAEFFAKVCGCQICKGVIGSDLARFAAFGEMHRASATAQRDSQTSAAAKMCRFHFLLNRLQEPKAVAKLASADRAKHVTADAKSWRDCYPLRQHLGPMGEHGYIELWADALNTAI